MNLMGETKIPAGLMGAAIARPTIVQTLTDEKERLEQRLSEINESLEALKKNPELERLLNLLAKSRY